ncbi:hypothetical protein RclHR1_09140001 [Rhizophagus clarus]|uniref:SAM domain-containing protein n=1 Tax=Rhizophagus clarus TaxID=94130 RepID=A0A2Z6S5M9_9GLOM|nr:hypothetical protein RclHR1_09140001 [Rhizophagus clarus]GES85027.1 hypothetical protein GLOIN_2v1782324 [Rhizophagus clarus]
MMSEYNTSTSVMEKNVLMKAKQVQNFKTTELINFLCKEESLDLIQDDYDIIRNERVSGRDFLKITEKKLINYGMKGGPASRLAEFAKELTERQLDHSTRNFIESQNKVSGNCEIMNTEVISVKIRPVFDMTYSASYQPYMSRHEFNDRVCQLNEILKKRQEDRTPTCLVLLPSILPVIGHIALIADVVQRNKKMMKSFKDLITKFNREDYGKLDWKITQNCRKGVHIHIGFIEITNREEVIGFHGRGIDSFHGREADYYGRESDLNEIF